MYYEDEYWTWRRASLVFLMLLCIGVLCVIFALIAREAIGPLPYRDPCPPTSNGSNPACGDMVDRNR